MGTTPDINLIGKEYIAHAERGWVAEREIAARYAERGRALVTLAASLIGAGLAGLFAMLFKVTEIEMAWYWKALASVLTAAPVALSIYHLFKVPIVILLSVRYPVQATMPLFRDLAARQSETSERWRPPTASYRLGLPDEALDWAEAKLEPALFIIFTKLLLATDDLQQRNLRERHRLAAGEQALTWGIRWAFVSILILTGAYILLKSVGGL